MSLSNAERAARLSKADRDKLYGSLTPEQFEALRYDWNFWARPEQLEPTEFYSIWYIEAGRGWGKLLSVETPIATPTGWTTMGQLRPGDQVFDESGKVCRVTWVSDEEVPSECFRLAFSDGSTIDACGEHQWVTWNHAERKAFLRSPYEDTTQFPVNWPTWRLRKLVGKGSTLNPREVKEALRLYRSGKSIRAIAKRLERCRQSLGRHIKAGRCLKPSATVREDSPGPRIRLTREIAATLTHGKRHDLNHCIPQCGCLQLPDRELPIPPYTLGAWLGDSSRCDATITQHENDQESLKRNIEADGFACSVRKHSQSVGILGLSPALRRSGLLKNKHIPKAYLRASVDQRVALLQGLMDTDGGVEGASSVSFSNCNTNLADGVYELVVSLGMRATRECRPKSSIGNYESHRVTFTPTIQVFRLPRKAERISFSCGQQLRRHHRMITEVKRIEPKPMRCISVDSPNSMYLAGLEMIPTHNSRTVGETVRKRSRVHKNILIAGPTTDDIRKMVQTRPGNILSLFPPSERPQYIPSLKQIHFQSGCIAELIPMSEPARFRGGGYEWAVFDEIAGVSEADAQASWDNFVFTMREGDMPQVMVSTTPKTYKLLKEIKQRKGTILTKGSSYDNRANLSESWYDQFVNPYVGTRLGRQEVFGEMLEDVPGALWTLEIIERNRICMLGEQEPVYGKTCVAIDPNATSKEGADACGIVGASLDKSNPTLGYLRKDATLPEDPKGSPPTPNQWAKRAIDLFREIDADYFVVEVNNGGEMVANTIHMLWPGAPIREVHASKSKEARAQPVSVIGEANRIKHVGPAKQFIYLESELTDWVPGKPSPNRLDAYVWAFSDLFVLNQTTGMLGAVKQLAEATADKLLLDSQFCPHCNSPVIQRIGDLDRKCGQCGRQWRIDRKLDDPRNYVKGANGQSVGSWGVRR